MNGKADITVGPNDIAERKETSVLAQALFIICCTQTDCGFHFDFFFAEVWVWNILYLTLNYFCRIISNRNPSLKQSLVIEINKLLVDLFYIWNSYLNFPFFGI